MRVAEIMTRDVQTISTSDTIQKAAMAMDNLNVGALPVCDGEELRGVITDRDITVRATAVGLAPADIKVGDIMSEDVDYVFEDDDVSEAATKMKERQIRRLPVVNQSKRLVGFVSLGDLATKDDSGNSADALEKVSSPSQPDRGQRGKKGG
ncbi:MAG: CBS domain-containing protein [Alphaproteobacteria bacterium]|nr:CBS domain-containing protein [Alphaproteobacteria bacterium]